MNKRKVLSILLLALITVTLAVSCSGSIDTPKQESEELAYVTFGNGHSRELGTSYETAGYSSLYWFYTAEKDDQYGTTGATTAEKPVSADTDADGNVTRVKQGLGGQVGPFSQGKWNFTLYAYETASVSGGNVTYSNLVYQGATTDVILKGNDVKNVPVTVSPQGNNGYVKFNDAFFKWAGNSGESKPTMEIKLTPATGSAITNTIPLNDKSTDGKLTVLNGTKVVSSESVDTIPAGFYTANVIVYLKDDILGIDNKGTPVFSQTFGLRVYGNATTYISGNMVEGVDTKVTFDVAEQEMILFTVVKDNKTDVSVPVTPDGVAQSNTVVSFPSGALDISAVHQLNVEVTPIASANQKFQVYGTPENENNTAVAGIELKMVKVVEQGSSMTEEDVTSFNGKAVTVTTFIAKNLQPESVSVKYLNGGNLSDDGISVISYTPSTGLLTFTTTHFSQYVVVASVEALNVSTGVPYTSLAEAIAAAGNGQEVRVMNDVILPSTVVVDSGREVILDLNGHNIETDTQPTDSTRHYYAIDNYGTITIEDSSVAQKGTISARGIGNYEDGLMIINSGNFESIDTNGGACVWNEADLIINGGKFSTTHVGTSSDSVGVGCLNNSGSALITGGSFSDVNKRTYAIISTGEIQIIPGVGKTVTVEGAHGALAIDSGTGAVYGGYYSSTDYYGLYVSNDGQGVEPEKAAVTVYGGTFDGKNYSVWIGSDYNNPVNSTIEILGGTFSKPLNAQACTREGAIQVKGGTFSADPSAYVASGHYPIIQDNKYVVMTLQKDSEDAYLIQDATHLVLFEKLVNKAGNSFRGKIVKLTSDIDLQNNQWTPVGQTGATQFQGTFDGQGHTISNLKVNNTDEYEHCASGLFGWLNSATVKNINIAGATVTGHHNVGVIAGYLETSGCTIENCTVTNATVSCTSANSEANGDKCGGIVGHAGNAGVEVKNCTVSDSTISAGRDAGQVVGAAKTVNVSNCSASSVTVKANGTSTGENIRNEVIGRVL